MWQRRYNRDAGIIGRRVTLNGRPHTVVGVMPPAALGAGRGRMVRQLLTEWAGRLNLTQALRDGARGSGQSGRRARLRNGLVIAEVALALVLLIGASLFVRSFLNLQSASPGFNTAPLLTLRFFMTGEAYANPEQRQQRVADIVRRIEGLPGVESVYASNFIPLGGGGGSAIVDGRAVAKGEEPNILFIGVTPHFQRTMGLPLIKGRDFSDAEGVSRTSTVIGVAPDVRQFDMTDETPMPAAFVPYPHASVIGAFGVTRVISSLLYNVTPSDPISFIGVAAFLTAIAFVASYLPARRATNVDPIVALRNE